jgi:hypothetical protein
VELTLEKMHTSDARAQVERRTLLHNHTHPVGVDAWPREVQDIAMSLSCVSGARNDVCSAEHSRIYSRAMLREARRDGVALERELEPELNRKGG